MVKTVIPPDSIHLGAKARDPMHCTRLSFHGVSPPNISQPFNFQHHHNSGLRRGIGRCSWFRGEHSQSRREHSRFRREQSQFRREHSRFRREQSRFRREHSRSRREHSQFRREHSKSRREHSQFRREHSHCYPKTPVSPPPLGGLCNEI